MSTNVSPKHGAQRYGWKGRDLPDWRDHHYTIPADAADIPAHVDLRETAYLPEVYNQGSLGSCTANAIAASFEYNEAKQGYGSSETFMPSRLFIYYNERKLEGSIGSDSGGMLRDGIKSVNTTGVCNETIWPYDVDKFTDEPSTECYQAARSERALKYRRVEQTRDAIRSALSHEGQPVVFGFIVYESFETPEVAESGKMPMPGADEKRLGGHAVLCVGYDQEEDCFIVRNSWGKEWGIDGYFKMPAEYMTNPDLASDFWIIETISTVPPTQHDDECGYHESFPTTEAPIENKAAVPGSPITFQGPLSTPGSAYKPGATVSVQWTGTTGSPVKLQYCIHSWSGMLSAWTPIADGQEFPASGSYEWVIPADASPDSRYWLQILSVNLPADKADSAYFTVSGTSGGQSLFGCSDNDDYPSSYSAKRERRLSR